MLAEDNEEENEEEEWEDEEEDVEEIIHQIIQLLNHINNDNSVPRNIRRAADEAIKIFESSEGTPAHKASNAISILDEISQDPNCPLYARTKIWNTVSLLETIQD